MSRRRDANRAEAVVRGVGSIFLLLMLGAFTMGMPQLAKGKSPVEMLDTVLGILALLVVCAVAVTVVGLLVWRAVRRTGV